MPETGTVTASALNLRRSPGGEIIRMLTRGAKVEILEEQGEFFKVNAGGQIGFVKASFIARGQEPLASGGPNPAGGQFHFEGKKAVAPDGTKFATKFKLGVFNNGETSIGEFVEKNSALFANVAPSRLRVMRAVSENEGKLEAINTWDNAFLTFGIFQWTVGADAGAGELPSVIARLRGRNLPAFEKFFGQHGLDTSLINTSPGTTPVGFFVLLGTPLKSPAQKAKLRTLEWAYRFWLAGHDDAVRQTQIEHAMERVDLFYRDSAHKIRSRAIADYVSSELGVALLLDEHVNRPGHVPGTLAKAVNQFVASLGSDSPESWSDAEEKKLLDTYVQLRNQTNMTDSKKRAETVAKSGLASNKRRSYQD